MSHPQSRLRGPAFGPAYHQSLLPRLYAVLLATASLNPLVLGGAAKVRVRHVFHLHLSPQSRVSKYPRRDSPGTRPTGLESLPVS